MTTRVRDPVRLTPTWADESRQRVFGMTDQRIAHGGSVINAPSQFFGPKLTLQRREEEPDEPMQKKGEEHYKSVHCDEPCHYCTCLVLCLHFPFPSAAYKKAAQSTIFLILPLHSDHPTSLELK
jgi:hypothetical protein